MFFLAIPGSAEVDLTAAALIWGSQGATVCFPRMDWTSKTMTPVAVDPGMLHTEVRRHGVPEPVGGRRFAADCLDLLVVPGLAFDASGGRLGRGGGFYDRFLAPLAGPADESGSGARPRPVICGVCFDEQVVDRVPSVAQDVRVHAVVTDRRIIAVHPGLAHV
jgi:5-formyltetrahydrofolate cyclo-ligase